MSGALEATRAPAAPKRLTEAVAGFLFAACTAILLPLVFYKVMVLPDNIITAAVIFIFFMLVIFSGGAFFVLAILIPVIFSSPLLAHFILKGRYWAALGALPAVALGVVFSHWWMAQG